MIHLVPDLLSAEQVSVLRQFVESKPFVDGKATNPASKVKHNQQVDQADPEADKIGDIVVDALFANPLVSRVAFPKTIPKPTLSKYEPGMHYGPHLDEALLQTKPRAMRSDLSCTVFISGPEDYEGGELELWLGNERPRIKAAAGSAVIYSSGLIHQVLPVTSGVRYVGVTWIQSLIPSPQRRQVLMHYHWLIERMRSKADADDLLLMESVRTNLYRLWADL